MIPIRSTPWPLLCWILFFIWIGGYPHSALAQPMPMSCPSLNSGLHEVAKGHFERANALYMSRQFGDALAEYEQSYRLHPAVEVLFNIALTQRGLKRYDEATTSLGIYLAQAGGMPAERIKEATQLIVEMGVPVGQLALTSTPARVRVTIDGRSTSMAPLGPLMLAAGLHVIELAAPAYESLRKELSIAAGEPMALAIELKAVPQLGHVIIIASPPQAKILIDGQLAGEGDAHLDLVAGRHTLDVSAPGYMTQQKMLEIHIGQEHREDVDLMPLVDIAGPKRPTKDRKKPSRQERVIGIVIGVFSAVGTAGAIGGVLGPRPELPTTGTLPPGRDPVNR
jgi:hypothetical protein